MTRTILTGAVRAVRRAALLTGLAVMSALLLGSATVALAAVPGDPFKLGRVNTINKLTSLVGSVEGAMLRIDNNGSGPTLSLETNADKPPLVVNADAGKAVNLDADKLDGKDSTDFLPGSYYIRTADSGPFNPGTPGGLGAQQADCDPNDLALSGGYDDVDRGTHVFRDRFIVSVSQLGEERPFTWNVAWINDSTPDTIKVWTLCLDR